VVLTWNLDHHHFNNPLGTHGGRKDTMSQHSSPRDKLVKMKRPVFKIKTAEEAYEQYKNDYNLSDEEVTELFYSIAGKYKGKCVDENCRCSVEESKPKLDMSDEERIKYTDMAAVLCSARRRYGLSRGYAAKAEMDAWNED